MVKKSVKRKRKESEKAKNVETEEVVKLPPSKRSSDEPAPKKTRWINKQRVLVFASRGINHRDRHLMEDIKRLMPHHRPESKMERSKNLQVINEMCEMKNCNKAMLFEGRKKRDLYMWLSNVPTGPCAKFLVENVYTMAELKMTGNCLKGSRPLLSFDENFNEKPQYGVLKELLTQIFGVPNHHPKSQPFFDHIYTFSILDNRIWFRNFQILTEDGALAEIGPRFVLNPVKIFTSSFGGETLWNNPYYISPAKYRQSLTKKAAGKYMNRIEQKLNAESNKPAESYALNPLDEIFKGDPLAAAEKMEELQEQGIDESAKVEKKKSLKVKFVKKKPKKHLVGKQNKKKKSIVAKKIKN
ncbi:ribosome biogenesis protein BRX1 homolog [Neodiprion fabricii]|uniref:ribosome biogenesis protein BRX1 homolog n=1 Tax=Neodiprion fabricii TaxID=2872261 RepID=UPI001ED8EB68|nr:ribosome biogenesis protein BRX1 homolog [Neodiprion fabricii]